MEKKLKTDELGRMTTEEYKKAPKASLIVILDNVRSAVNVGSVFRTADAFRAEKLILCGITPSPNREMRKTALGATESVHWERSEDIQKTVKDLQETGYSVFGVEQTTASIDIKDLELQSRGKYALVLGHEVYGITEELLPILDGTLEIPQYGTKHSLNISVCAGIVIWEFFRRTTDPTDL